MADPELRPFRAEDAAPARALLETDVARSRYTELQRAALEGALAGNEELRALVAASDGDLLGLVIYGPIAGTIGTGKIHLIIVTAAARLRGVAARLCDAAVSALADEGARLVVAEVPDQPALRPGIALLRRGGWREEARIADYVADGVALLLLRRDIR